MNTAGRVALVLLLLLVLGAAGALLVLINRGFSARDEPLAAEAFVARQLRTIATPRRARAMENPIPLTDEVLADARVHFADHCAICHGNDGSGETEFGENMYPKAPDMRLPETQSLSDGELFYIIENGIRFTGMPAFGLGTAESSHDTWELVHFIRHLPQITPEELAEMERYNLRSFDEWEREMEIRRFLEEIGDGDEPVGHGPR